MSQIIKPTGGAPPPTPNVITLSDDVGVKVNADASGNIQIEGQLNEQLGGFFPTVVATQPAPGSHELMINPMSPARWIVDGLSTTANPNGTHTTITAAIASAKSGDTILILPKGSPYVEDFTLPAGVNLTGFVGDSYDSNVTITGQITYSAGGSAVISGINLQTNNNFFLHVTGTAASRLVLKDCVLSALNHTGISFDSSNSSALIFLEGCFGNVASNTSALYSQSSPGTLLFEFCSFTNGAASAVNSTNSAGAVNWENCITNLPIATSGTGAIFIDNCQMDTSALNTTTITTVGTGLSNCYNSYIASGSATAINIGGGTTFDCGSIDVNSTNTNAISGTGTLGYPQIEMVQSFTLQSTLTLAPQVVQSGRILAPNGTQAAPAYSFNTSQDAGMWLNGSETLSFGVSNSEQYRVTSGAVNFFSNAVLTTLCYGGNLQSFTTGTFSPLAQNSLYLSCDPSGGTITLKLPDDPTSSGGRNGQLFIIKDATGNAATHNITVTTVTGAKTFDGATSYVLNVNFQSLSVVYNGTTGNYEII